MFNHSFVIAVAVLALVSSDTPRQGNAKSNDAIKGELKRLSGAWVFVDAEQGGKTYTDADLNRKRCEFVITGDAFTTFVDGRVVQTGSFTIDPSKTPKTIDVEISPPLAGHMPGIYEVDGGRIKVCWGPINGERPTSLNSPPGALCWSIRGKRK